MKELVKTFPQQLKDALTIGVKTRLNADSFSPVNVVICGLGGSGIGGTIASQLVGEHCPVPVIVSKDYFLPGFVSKKTLVIVSSYSGNTEETLQCMEEAIAKNCRVVCITSGGKVAARAAEKKLECILVPGGLPPRACLGYSLVQLLFIITAYKLASATIIEDLKKATSFITGQSSNIEKKALEVSNILSGKFPFIYSTTKWEGVAIRFRQQLNENAKILCSHHVIPEMNHNELVGWTGIDQNLAVVVFRDRDEYPRNDARIVINLEIIKKYTSTIVELWSEGKTDIEKALYMIHLGDWISVFLAEQRGVDPVEVNVIDYLKGSLAKK